MCVCKAHEKQNKKTHNKKQHRQTNRHKKGKQNPQSLQIGSRKGSFVGGSSFETSFVNETDADRSEREKKELAENFRVMTNDEYKDQLKRRDFHDFLNKTSRIIERALDNQFDVVGDFFRDDDEEDQQARTNKKEKMT